MKQQNEATIATVPTLSLMERAPVRFDVEEIWRPVGAAQLSSGLTRLLAQIQALEPAYGPCPTVVAARLIVEAALARQESRGGHFRSDFPASAEPVRTFVTLTSADAAVRYAAE